MATSSLVYVCAVLVSWIFLSPLRDIPGPYKAAATGPWLWSLGLKGTAVDVLYDGNHFQDLPQAWSLRKYCFPDSRPSHVRVVHLFVVFSPALPSAGHACGISGPINPAGHFGSGLCQFPTLICMFTQSLMETLHGSTALETFFQTDNSACSCRAAGIRIKLSLLFTAGYSKEERAVHVLRLLPPSSSYHFETACFFGTDSRHRHSSMDSVSLV